MALSTTQQTWSTTAHPVTRDGDGDSYITGDRRNYPGVRYHRTTYVTMGVAPGDGDLIPPPFSSDRETDADEWMQDLLDYNNTNIYNARSVSKHTESETQG